MMLPRLLDDQMSEIARLVPVSASLDLAMAPLSTAQVILGTNDPGVIAGQWVELFTPHESAGIFRVQQVERSYSGTTLLRLEHGLVSLADSLIPAQADNVQSTAPHALQAVLSHQSMWQLGQCDVPETEMVTWSYNYSNVLEAFLALLDELPAYMPVFHQDALPWVVDVIALTDDDASECRLTRNLRSLTVESDRSELCTRLYIPIEGAETVILNADTQSDYGIVSRSLSGDSGLTAEDLTQSGLQYLEQHQHPKVVVTLNAFDLYQATGEALDRFRLGRMCRVCLPEHATTIRQRVVQIAYPDVYSDPENVRLTLADKAETTADVLAGLVVETTVIRKKVIVAESKLGSDAQWYTQRVATGVISKELSKRYLNIMLADGTTEYVSFVSDFELTPATKEIHYIGRTTEGEK